VGNRLGVVGRIKEGSAVRFGLVRSLFLRMFGSYGGGVCSKGAKGGSAGR